MTQLKDAIDRTKGIFERAFDYQTINRSQDSYSGKDPVDNNIDCVIFSVLEKCPRTAALTIAECEVEFALNHPVLTFVVFFGVKNDKPCINSIPIVRLFKKEPPHRLGYMEGLPNKPFKVGTK